eukprot:gene22871-biopygen10290
MEWPLARRSEARYEGRAAHRNFRTKRVPHVGHSACFACLAQTWLSRPRGSWMCYGCTLLKAAGVAARDATRRAGRAGGPRAAAVHSDRDRVAHVAHR